MLRYNPSTSTWLLYARTPALVELAAQVGLDQSMPATAREGCPVYYSSCEYAALPFWDVADAEARRLLADRRAEYEASYAENGPHAAPCPADRSFMPFQLGGIAYALARPHALIGDDMGLGKTCQAIGVANAMGAERTLVVCPANVRLQWQREVRAWSTLKNLTTYPILKSQDGVSPRASYTFVSYDLLRSGPIFRSLMALRFDLLIGDEIHYAKSTDAQRAIRFFGDLSGMRPGLASRAEKVVALSGTPMPNRPRECLGGSVKVLTNRGWTSIVDVKKSDLLWDGEEWVGHQGLLYQGCARTVSVAGIIATPTHSFLAKSSWVSAGAAAQNTAILSLILESGSINLPWWAWNSRLLARSVRFAFSVTAALRPLVRRFKGFESGGLRAADLAAPSKAPGKQTLGTSKRAQTISTENAFSTLSAISSTDVKSLRAGTIANMGGAVFESIHRVVANFLDTLFLSRVGIRQDYSSTESTTIVGMNPGTFVGPRERRTCKTVEKFMRCSSESSSWRPVYDLVNAGPRRRFTVLSDRGPVIAHNCYLVARHLCWDALDWLSEDGFRYRFNPSAAITTKNGKVFNREEKGRLPELRARLRCNFMVRRLLRSPEIKRQVDACLPQYELTYVEPNGAIQRVLKAEKLLDIDPDHLEQTDAETWGHIATLRREMGVAKAPRVVEHVRMLLDGGLEKVAVFAHHREVMDFLADRLSGGVRIWGGTTSVAKQRIVDQFIVDPRVRVIVGQMQSIGVGTDGLQRVCRWCVLAEPDWTPGMNEQVIRRIARHGQTRDVHAQFMAVEGSLDERILSSMLRKMHITHHALDGEG